MNERLSPLSGGCKQAANCAEAGKDASACAGCPSGGRQDSSGQTTEQTAAMREAVARMKHVLFVMSGKGGVGKSSVAANLAVGLALKGFRTGLLDVDFHGPSIAGLFGLRGGLDMDPEGKKILPARPLPNLLVLSADSLLKDKSTALIWRGPKKSAAIRQFLGQAAWGDLDFLVVDSPPGTGDEHQSILQNIPDALCLMVTTPQELALADVRKAMNFLQHVRGRVLGVVENMSGLACPHCGGHIDLFASGGGKVLAEHYGVPFLGAVALDPAAVVAADRGTPLLLLPEETRAKGDFLALTEVVIEAVREQKAVRLRLPGADSAPEQP